MCPSYPRPKASSGITNGRQIVSDALSENRQTERRVPVYALVSVNKMDEARP